MKFRWDKKYLYWGITAFLVIVCSVLFFFALFRIDVIKRGVLLVLSILMPIIYGMAFAYLLSPAVNFFDRHLLGLFLKRAKKMTVRKQQKIARVISVCVTVLLAICAVTALISMIIPQLISSIAGFVESLPGYLVNLGGSVKKLLEDNPNISAEVDKFIKAATINYDQIYDRVREFLPSVNNFLSGVTTGVFGALNVVKNVGVGIIVSIYLLYSKEMFAAQGKKVLYALLETKHANSVLGTARETHRVFGSFIIGKLLDSLIIGILCFICMTIFGMPLPLLVSVIIGVTNIIPFFGPFIGAIPAALIILLVSPKSCIPFIIFVFVLQQFDGNILGPKILGDSTGLSSFWVIFSILVGGGLFGFVGMIVGVPFFAVIYMFVRMLLERTLKSKGLPEETNDYRDLKLIDATNKSVVLLDEKDKA